MVSISTCTAFAPPSLLPAAAVRGSASTGAHSCQKSRSFPLSSTWRGAVIISRAHHGVGKQLQAANSKTFYATHHDKSNESKSNEDNDPAKPPAWAKELLSENLKQMKEMVGAEVRKAIKPLEKRLATVEKRVATVESNMGLIIEAHVRPTIRTKYLLDADRVEIKSLTGLALEVINATSDLDLRELKNPFIATGVLAKGLAEDDTLPLRVLNSLSKLMASKRCVNWVQLLEEKQMEAAEGGKLLYEIYMQHVQPCHDQNQYSRYFLASFKESNQELELQEPAEEITSEELTPDEVVASESEELTSDSSEELTTEESAGNKLTDHKSPAKTQSQIKQKLSLQQSIMDTWKLLCQYVDLPREEKGEFLQRHMHIGMMFATAHVSDGEKCQPVVEIDVKGERRFMNHDVTISIGEIKTTDAASTEAQLLLSGRLLAWATIMLIPHAEVRLNLYTFIASRRASFPAEHTAIELKDAIGIMHSISVRQKIYGIQY